MSRVRSSESAGKRKSNAPETETSSESSETFLSPRFSKNAFAFFAFSAASRTARFRSPRSAYSSTSATCAARGSCTTSRNPTTFT